MKIPTLPRAILPAVSSGISAASFAAVKFEEQVLLPKVGHAQVVVSPSGTHVAAIMAKGRPAVVGSGQHVVLVFIDPLQKVVFDGRSRDLT